MTNTDIRHDAARRGHVVLLIHGIRTQGEWQQRAAATLEEEPTIRVRPTRYEFFDVVRFLLPFDALRRYPVTRVTTLIRDELTKHPDQISIVAHSFGTYIVSQMLLNEPDLDFHRIILCGSIIPDGFPWEKFRHRLSPQASADWQVVNDCGLNDPWPVLAQSITWGYGASGRFGFGHGRVKDRYHAVGHSGFFDESFVRRYWLPYLVSGDVVEGQLGRPQNSWWISISTVLRLRYLALAAVALSCFIVADRVPVVRVSIAGTIASIVNGLSGESATPPRSDPPTPVTIPPVPDDPPGPPDGTVEATYTVHKWESTSPAAQQAALIDQQPGLLSLAPFHSYAGEFKLRRTADERFVPTSLVVRCVLANCPSADGSTDPRFAHGAGVSGSTENPNGEPFTWWVQVIHWIAPGQPVPVYLASIDKEKLVSVPVTTPPQDVHFGSQVSISVPLPAESVAFVFRLRDRRSGRPFRIDFDPTKQNASGLITVLTSQPGATVVDYGFLIGTP